MFNPFPRPKVPGFNLRPEDDTPGFRVNPPQESIGFNLDENGLPDSDQAGQTPAPYPFGFPPGAAQPPPPLAPLGQPLPEWLHRLLSMPLPSPSAPLNVRWSVPDGLLVNRAIRELDTNPQPSGPEASGSVLAQPSEGDEPYPQADAPASEPQRVNERPPWPGPSVTDANFILGNADGDGVREAQQQRPLPQNQPRPQTKPPTSPAAGQAKTPPPARVPGETRDGNDRARAPARTGIRRTQQELVATEGGRPQTAHLGPTHSEDSRANLVELRASGPAP
jgi:hypothetical protein